MADDASAAKGKGGAAKASKGKAPAKEPKEPKAKRPSGGGGGGAPSGKKSKKGEEDLALEEDVDDVDLAARPDPSEGAKVVVIHPGSMHVRIGLSDSPTPRVIPHCVAYRRTAAAALPAAASAGAASTRVSAGESVAVALEPSLAPLARQLRLSVRLVGKQHPPVAPGAVPVSADEVAAAAAAASAAAPASAAAADASGSAAITAAETDDERVLVGEAALRAASAAPDEWRLVYPLQWGALHLRDGSSERGLLSALELIWTCAICGGGGEPGLGLGRGALSDACVVVALPDLFERRLGAEVLSLLLGAAGLGFKAAIVHEEAACAAFGVGAPSACVVDVGAQRTSVCCIDEGMPMPGCRQLLAYGGDDMDVLTHCLLHRQRLASSLPHLAAPPSYTPSLRTALTLRAIRQRCASLHLVDPPATDGASGSAADVPPPPLPADDGYARVHLGSLAALPSLLLFAPSAAAAMHKALGFTRPANTFSASAPSAGDGKDGKGGDVKGADGKGGGGGGGQAGRGGGEDAGRLGPPEARSAHTLADHSDVWDDEFLADSALERALPAGVTPAGPKDVFVGAANFAPQLTEVGCRFATGLTADANFGYTPLDEAVVRSVERGKSTEVKRRLYGTILLLGGGARTPGLAEYLEWRIQCGWRIAMDSTEGIERVEVLRLPDGTEPESVAWRGAATLPELETGRALWILARDWERSGALAAREACAFSW